MQFSILFLILSIMQPQQEMKMLCLGDSYTIGESVSANERFPEQTVSLLNKKGLHFKSPEIIARTGWTSKDLITAIASKKPASDFDYVTLLIGVNDQFQGKSISSYETNFEFLLKQAIAFASNQPEHVFVISIPDYGVTPFANRLSNSQAEISNEIDAFNAVNKKIAEKYHAKYAEITISSRNAKADRSLLADDGLHPSAKMYKEWSEKIVQIISN